MSKFNVNAMAEAIVTLKGGETAKALLNKELKAAKAAKANWVEIRDPLANALEKRGLTDGSLKVTLATVKWCFEQGVELETLTLSRMKDRADKGLVTDLLTGKPKTVKATGKGKGKAKAGKAKAEAVVKHCGYGLADAMGQAGFIKFFDTLVYNLSFGDYEALALDDLKLDFVRAALVECGYMVQDGAEYKVAIIREADDEAGE